MIKRVISAYTPSNTDPETRERIFVQRHKLLSRVVRWCEESMLTGNKHHLLFIGPRGSGKTHLVAMARDRLVQNPKLADKMRIAWLGEDNVFTGLIDVALEIADELAKEYPDEFSFNYRTHARSLPADEAAESILDEVIRRLGDKSILLIMENLDRAFHGLRDVGQKKWRAFLQETGRIATLATSQQLFEDISSRDAAFYGFFEIIHLEPLSVEDARQLMSNIARENNNTELVQFMATSEGRYRVRALQHLAGGNHRMYVMLSEFLTKESLDGLVAAFEELAEDLTPYFQERIRSLSPQQARIVQSLCNASGAMTVKEVAEDSFIADRNVSKQLGELKHKGYVVSERRGKESYYEMAEPLMRLCLEVKKQRGAPLKLVAAFFRAWYSANSIQAELEFPSHVTSADPRLIAYKRVALEADDAFQQLIRQSLDQEFESRMESKDFVDAMNLAEELEYSDRPTGLMRKARVLREQRRLAEALKVVNEVLSLPGLTTSQETDALLARGVTYCELGEPEIAIADDSVVIEMTDSRVDQKAKALFNRGVAYGQLGKSERAIADYSAVIRMVEAPVDVKTKALINRGVAYGEVGEGEKEIADYSAVIQMTDAPPDQRSGARFNRGVAYTQLGISEKAIVDYSAVIDIMKAPVERKGKALINRAVTYSQLGDPEKAIADYSAAIGMQGLAEGWKAEALIGRGRCYGQVGDFEKGIADHATVIETASAPSDIKARAMNQRGVIFCNSKQFGSALNEFSSVVTMTGVSSSTRTFALFCIVEAMVPTKPLNEAIAGLQRAFEEGDSKVSEYGAYSRYILKAVLDREHSSWSDFVEKLVPIYAQHEAVSSLGTGLTESIAVLDASGFSEAQLDSWNAAWQKAGAEYDELEIPLAALDASVQVIKTGSDRPLFDLPLEIRKIVRPLLRNSLSEN